MALMKCPECGKEISDKASVCPNCGFLLSSSASRPRFQISSSETPVGPLERKPFTGCASIVVGLCGVPLMFVLPPIGILMIIGSIIMIISGITNMGGYCSVTCPYCHTSGQMDPSAPGYTCPACRKRSAHDKIKSVLRTVD